MASTGDPPSAPSSYAQKSAGGSTIGITVGVAVPIILIIATTVIILILLLAYMHYRNKQEKKMDGYMNVPQEDTGSHLAGIPPKSAPSTKKTPPIVGGTGLPYPMKLNKPARVQIEDPQPPTTFVQAMQLDSSGGTGYQFREPQPLSAHDVKQYRGQGKKRNGKRSHLHSSGSSDRETSSSPNSRELAERKISGQSSPRPGQASPRPGRKFSVPMVPLEDQPRLPEICLQLTYREKLNRLTIKVDRVAYLPFREDGSTMDTYVRLFFIPKLSELPQRKTSKTQTQRGTSPIFDEELTYEAMTPEEVINSTLHVEVLDYRSYGKHHILGQGDLPLIQVKFEAEVASITLPLHLPKVKENLGTVLLSLCYSPEDKKLSVIILRAKDLNKGNTRETDAQAKVWITLGGDKILGRLRTRRKPQSCSPIFNEALTATIEPNQMKNTSVNVALTNENKQALKKELGQVILCGQSSAEEFRHWNDILASPGKQIAEWHELR